MTRLPSVAYRHLTGPKKLEEIYREYVVSGSARGRDGIDPGRLEAELRDVVTRMSQRLRAGSYEFTQYRQLLLSRGAGKTPRVISIPTARDRIALKALAILLVEVFPSVRASLPQTKVEQVRRALQDARLDTYVRLDVKDFYPSVDHGYLQSVLGRRIKSRAVQRVVFAALETPTVADGGRKLPRSAGPSCGVPQGLAISNLLAELVLQDADATLEAEPDARYFRYVDDILILCPSSRANDLRDKARALLAAAHLSCHGAESGPTKSSLAPVADSFDYLGYVFDGQKVSVRTASVRRLESALARQFTRYAKQSTGGAKPDVDALALARCLWFVNLTITGCISEGVARGWLHYFRQLDDLALLVKLDCTVGGFKKRFGLRALPTKTFMRSYWAIKHQPLHATSYVPNFDEFGVSEMRQHLRLVSDDDEAFLTDAQVTSRWRLMLKKAVADLESDVGFLS